LLWCKAAPRHSALWGCKGALLGLQAVTVEVHLANGLPSFTLVGLADVEVKEARERVRSALQNAGLEFPHNKRITVNLAPADLPKDSGRFDLPIALGILAASGQIDASRLAGHEFAGELSLSGELRPVRGALATSLALRAHQVAVRLVLPPGSAEEAALVPGAGFTRAPPAGCGAAFLPAGAQEPIDDNAAMTTAGACCSPHRWPRKRSMPTWPMSRARWLPNARWKSRPPAGTAC
jgi:magnesium chelatase family protein